MAAVGIRGQKRQVGPLSPENMPRSHPRNGSMDIVGKKLSCSSLVGMVFGFCKRKAKMMIKRYEVTYHDGRITGIFESLSGEYVKYADVAELLEMEGTYTCVFCDTTFLIHSQCRDHEQDCSLNPKNRTCDTCWHYVITLLEHADEVTTACSIRDFEPFNRNCDGWKPRLKKY